MKIAQWFGNLFPSIAGGWKTHGPGSMIGNGAFATDEQLYKWVTARAALQQSVVHSAMKLRAETVGSFPIRVMDNANKLIADHDLYGILRNSPNADMTGAEFWSAATANYDMYGNSFSIIDRWQNGDIKALTPVETERMQIKVDSSGKIYFETDGEKYSRDRILHLKAFSLDGYTGLSFLQAARRDLSGAQQAQDAAAQTWRSGLRHGGFFTLPEGKVALTNEQVRELGDRMAKYADPSNQGKWMPLLPGLTPVANQQFKLSPVDAQLLASRYFSIEELCRFLNVPPPLIGHTDKASSWASSLTSLNLAFVTYSLLPTVTRFEQRILKQLVKPTERNKINVKFNMDGLLRSDPTERRLSWESGLKHGYYNVNDVLAMDNRPGIGPEGDIYRVQLNMSNSENPGNEKATP